jgi:hypothetical protein
MDASIKAMVLRRGNLSPITVAFLVAMAAASGCSFTRDLDPLQAGDELVIGSGGAVGQGGASTVGGSAGTEAMGGLPGELGGAPAAGGVPEGVGGDPGTGGDDPGTGGDDPGTGGDDPGTGGDDPGTGGEDPGTGGEDPGTGGEDPGTGGDDPGTGGEDPGTGGEGTGGDPGDCTDGRTNGNETDVDCGGTDCEGCLPGQACVQQSDCAPVANATVDCASTVCEAACEGAWLDCDTDLETNGCETDSDTDPAHCGGCNQTCDGVCSAGECCSEIPLQQSLNIPAGGCFHISDPTGVNVYIQQQRDGTTNIHWEDECGNQGDETVTDYTAVGILACSMTVWVDTTEEVGFTWWTGG